MDSSARISVTRFLIVALLTVPGILHAQEKVTVALWGDSRENLDNACENIASVLLYDITDWDVQVHTGDFTHHGSEEDWQRSLGYRGIKQLFVPGKFLLCTSNHDCEKGTNDTWDKRSTWDEHTRGVLPVNDADGTTHFYAWHKANVYIVFCDAFLTDPATMQRWLDGYLERVKPGDWLVGVWHDPAYDLTYKEAYLPVCRPWLESLERHGGDFVFNGHAHLYLRSNPLRPDGTVDAANGIIHIINGTGGASWKDPAPADPRTAFTPSVKSFPCITFVTFEGNTARLRTVDARPGKSLQTIDSCSWNR